MQRYRFGDYELNLDAFELLCRGEPVRLERRPLDLLIILVRRAGSLVPRDELIETLWPKKVIIDFDAALHTLVRKVRTALADSSEHPQFIETVPGRGYRFVAPVVAVDESTHEIAPPVVAATRTHSLSRRTRLIVAALVLMVGATVVFTSLSFVRDPVPARIVVLPFENLTGEEELGYLAAGLAEDTSITLARMDPDNLLVVGVAAPAITEPSQSIQEVGGKLGVDYVVMSSLRREQSRIRVTSRLFRAADSEMIWSASIDRELTNVLGLQRELGIAIAEQIRLRLSPEVAADIERRQSANPAAYDLYLRGRFEWLKLTPASIRRAMEYFEQATVEDPSYALAWAGLAFTSITSTRTADARPADVVPIASEALEQAVRLGPDLAETQYARGYYSLFIDLDRRAAAEAARVAIELDANNAQAHMLLGISLGPGQVAEALEVLRRARELDPVFALAFANSSYIALVSGDRDQALDLARQAVAISPDLWVGYLRQGDVLSELGDLDSALESYSVAWRLSGGHSLTYIGRAKALAGLGRLAELQALLTELTERETRQYVPPYNLATVNALLGDDDQAFAWLDRAVDERDLELMDLSIDPTFEHLHGDERFASLLSRCECSPEAEASR